ncbi:MAG: hypothetical protein ABW006_02645 [Hyphomicrobium sp.]
MAFGELVTLVSSVIAVATAIPAARDQYRKDPAGFWKSLKLMGLYTVYVFVGLGILLLSVSGPQPPAKAGIATAFMLGWIAYGGVWLVRLAPHYRALPVWFDRRWSLIDYGFAALIVLSGTAVVFS